MPYARISQALDQIAETREEESKERWLRTAFMSYRASPPRRDKGKQDPDVIPWQEWIASLNIIEGEELDVEKGEGLRNAERILNNMQKHGTIRAATKDEIEKIKKQRAKKAK